MRPDFGKCVTEKPRAGGGIRIRHKKQEFAFDELPQKISMRKPWKIAGHEKEFTDVLGPLKRFLRSCVGKYWDKVYSEIVQSMDTRSLQGSHLMDHLFHYIKTNAIIIDGKICNPNGERCYSEFYVCPKNGTVKINKDYDSCAALRRYSSSQPKRVGNGFPADGTNQYHKLLGADGYAWFYLTLIPIGTPEADKDFRRNYCGYISKQDVAYNFTYSYDPNNRNRKSTIGKHTYYYYDDPTSEARGFYGDKLICIKKRQMNSREIKKANLEQIGK